MFAKKLYGWALALCMLLSLLPASAWATDGTWTGTGTEADPYILVDAADLQALAESVNGGESYEGCWFRLRQDINLTDISWTPIGGVNESFAGTFLGRGHSITGLSVEGGGYSGLFGSLSGRVQDLSVSGSVSGGSNTGGIAGENAGVILNCDFTGTVSGNDNTGGLVGVNTGRIENCVSRATVSGGSPTGGVAGRNGGTIKDCTNDGPVSGSADNVGGVAGSSTGTLSGCLNTAKGTVSGGGENTGGMVGNASGTVENCTNKGAVTGKGSNTGGIAGNGSVVVTGCLNAGAVSGGGRNGGMVGNSCGRVENCTNQAVISGGSSTGGMVGYGYNGCTITGCLNSGKINCPEFNHVGGILGDDKNVDSDYIAVIGCTNTGEVIGTGTTNGNDSFTGGIVGQTNYGTVKDCLNTGKVTGVGVIGGIAGVKLFGPVENCTNTGKVTGSGTWVGGIGGQASANGCVNSGAVSGTTEVGGIAGVSPPDSTFENCLNSGSVTGTDYVGGILGRAFKGSSVANCRNAGRVTGSGYVGGISGYGHNVTFARCVNCNTVSASSYFVGGILGRGSFLTIKDSYDWSSVYGLEHVGGILGYVEDRATLTNTYCYAPADGENGKKGIDCEVEETATTLPKVGALVGGRRNTSCDVYLTRNYWSTGCAWRGLGWVKEYALLWHNDTDYRAIFYTDHWDNHTGDYFKDWDFTNVWYLDGTAGVPRLRWETAEPAGGKGGSGGSGGAGGTGNAKGVLYLSGSGAEADPFRVANADDWAELSTFLNGGGSVAGKYFLQAEDFSTDVMMGSSGHPFDGVYDGGSHILDVALSSEETGCAPFSRISGATLQHIKVTGTVEGGMHCAGLVGCVSGGKNTIEDCLVAADITTGGTHCGGIVGHGGSATTSMSGCVFAGSITAEDGGGQNVGVLWGWSDSGANVSIINCLEAGTGYSGCTGLNPVGLGDKKNFTLWLDYYRNPRITNGSGPNRDWGETGFRICELAGAPGVSIGYPEKNAEFSTCGLQFYENYAVLRLGEKDYIAAGMQADLQLSYETAEGEEVLRWMVNAGALTGTGDTFELTMPAADELPAGGVVITPFTRTVLVQGDTLTYTYTFPTDRNYVDVIAAWYDENGAMQGCAVDSFNRNGERTGTLKVAAGAAKYKLFFLDGESKPVEVVWEK